MGNAVVKSVSKKGKDLLAPSPYDSLLDIPIAPIIDGCEQPIKE